MKNQIIKEGLINSIFVMVAQFVSFALGIAKALVLPAILGVTNFGYWSVYLLYLSYVGLFAFGFNDGIYLRYGKYNYEELPKPIFRSSIRVFIITQLIIMVGVFSLILLEPDPNKQKALTWVCINIPISGLTGVLIYILQLTNQMKRYSFFTVLDKIIVLVMIFFIYILKIDQFLLIIIVDTFSKLIVLAGLVYSCKDILLGKGCEVKIAYKEIKQNVSVGIKLMLANLFGMLVMGLGRFIVERFEPVKVYGIYSFALSTTNLVLVFISAVGLVIYPTLNRTSEEDYPRYMMKLNEILSIIVFGLLLFYFPLRILVNHFMVDYTKIFDYLPLIFVIIFIQAKMQIIINPYYKLLREEKSMLKANFTGLLMAILFIVPFYIIYRSVIIIVLGTFLAMSIRLYLSELYIKKKLHLKRHLNVSIEICSMIIFILFAYQNNILLGFTGYITIYLFYLISNGKNVLLYIKLFNLRRG